MHFSPSWYDITSCGNYLSENENSKIQFSVLCIEYKDLQGRFPSCHHDPIYIMTWFRQNSKLWMANMLLFVWTASLTCAQLAGLEMWFEALVCKSQCTQTRICDCVRTTKPWLGQQLGSLELKGKSGLEYEALCGSLHYGLMLCLNWTSIQYVLGLLLLSLSVLLFLQQSSRTHKNQAIKPLPGKMSPASLVSVLA